MIRNWKEVCYYLTYSLIYSLLWFIFIWHGDDIVEKIRSMIGKRRLRKQEKYIEKLRKEQERLNREFSKRMEEA